MATTHSCPPTTRPHRTRIVTRSASLPTPVKPKNDMEHEETTTQYLKQLCTFWPASCNFDAIAISYVLPVLWMTSCFHIIEQMGQNRRRRVCSVEFATWRHRGRSLSSPTASCLQSAVVAADIFMDQVYQRITVLTRMHFSPAVKWYSFGSGGSAKLCGRFVVCGLPVPAYQLPPAVLFRSARERSDRDVRRLTSTTPTTFWCRPSGRRSSSQGARSMTPARVSSTLARPGPLRAVSPAGPVAI